MAGQAYGVSNVAVELGTARWLVAGAANPFGKMDCGAADLFGKNGLVCGAAKSRTKAASPRAIAAVTILPDLPLRENVR